MQPEEDEHNDNHPERSPPLEWKDYVALTIAAFETTFLPVIIVMLTLVGLAMLIVHLWKL